MKTIEQNVLQVYLDAGMSDDEAMRHLALIVGSGIIKKNKSHKALLIKSWDFDVLITVRENDKEAEEVN